MWIGGSEVYQNFNPEPENMVSKNEKLAEAKNYDSAVSSNFNQVVSVASDMVDQYVSQINSSAPILGPDSVSILGAARDKNKIIYKINAPYITTNSDVSAMNSSTMARKLLCNQEAEKFFLSRGFSIEWIYVNGRNEYIGSVNLKPENCR